MRARRERERERDRERDREREENELRWGTKTMGRRASLSSIRRPRHVRMRLGVRPRARRRRICERKCSGLRESGVCDDRDRRRAIQRGEGGENPHVKWPSSQNRFRDIEEEGGGVARSRQSGRDQRLAAAERVCPMPAHASVDR